MLEDIAKAVGMVLVIEGIMPFCSPNLFREWVSKFVAMDNTSLRVIGFISMIAGLSLVVWF
jgi:uncharacterized protein YjeT (DUF2065 family)